MYSSATCSTPSIAILSRELFMKRKKKLALVGIQIKYSTLNAQNVSLAYAGYVARENVYNFG